MPTNPWSERELRQLRQFRSFGYPADIIARRMPGRSEAAVQRKIARLEGTDHPSKKIGRPKPSHDYAKRRCLKCQRNFDSDGIGNRLCENCKASNRGMG